MRCFFCLLTGLMTLVGQAREEILKDKQGMDCRLLLPSQINPNTTYQIIVGAHGLGGNSKGLAINDWVKRGDLMVLLPKFETGGARPFQNGDGIHAEKLIDLFKQVQSRYRVRDKLFIHGFSAGAQFAHRFTMYHPEFVCGVSAHSAGSWATDGFGIISPQANTIPFAISCGEQDTQKAFASAKFTRLEWFHRFREEIDRQDFPFLAKTWPNSGHALTPDALDLTRQCFQLATGLPGKSATKRVKISAEWRNIERINPPPTGATPKHKSPSIPQSQTKRLKISRAAIARAKQERIADNKLVAFMQKYPPADWKSLEGSEQLLKQCTRAAKAWRKAASEAGKFTPENQERFQQFTRGLNLD